MALMNEILIARGDRRYQDFSITTARYNAVGISL